MAMLKGIWRVLLPMLPLHRSSSRLRYLSQAASGRRKDRADARSRLIIALGVNRYSGTITIGQPMRLVATGTMGVKDVRLGWRSYWMKGWDVPRHFSRGLIGKCETWRLRRKDWPIMLLSSRISSFHSTFRSAMCFLGRRK